MMQEGAGAWEGLESFVEGRWAFVTGQKAQSWTRDEAGPPSFPVCVMGLRAHSYLT